MRKSPGSVQIRTRPALIGWIVLLLLGLVWALFWVHPWYEATEETNDASMYILCAKSLLAGHGYEYLGEPFTVRPPGFSLLLAPFLAWRGVDFVALNWIGWFFGIAGVLGLYALLLPRVGAWIALAVALALGLNPAWQTMSNQVMTDVPGVALAIACLLLERWASRTPSPRRDALLGLAIALSAYIRTANALLLPAILAARTIERWRASRKPLTPTLPWSKFALQRLALLPLVVVALLLPWSIRCSLHHPEPPVDQNYLFSYGTGLFHVDPADPASPRRPMSDLFARVPLRASQILPALGGRMERHANDPWLARIDIEASEEETSDAHMWAGALLLAALLALAIWRARASEIFALLVLGVLLVYFGFRDRLVTPVYVFSFAALVELGFAGLRRWRGAFQATAITTTLVLALALLDCAPRRDWARIEAGHAAYQRAAADARALLPENARIATTIGWHWSVYLDRPVYSLIFGYRRRGGVRGLEEVVARRAIDHVFFAGFLGDDRNLLPVFRAAHTGGSARGDVTVLPLR